MARVDAQDARIAKIVGDEDDATYDDCVDKFREHFAASLVLKPA